MKRSTRAFLFTGLSGTGKKMAAEVIARISARHRYIFPGGVPFRRHWRNPHAFIWRFRALAAAKLYYHHDWPAAERDFRRGFELSPNFAEMHGHYAVCLILLGRKQEAFAETQRALDLDPLSPRFGFWLINPDIVLLQEVRDYDACARLGEAIAPGIYHVAICSTFKEPFLSGLGKQQVAILSKYQAQAVWSEPWKSMNGVDPPRGFAFAWFKIGNEDVGVYSVHLKSNLITRGDKEAEAAKNIRKREVAMLNS